MRIINYYYYVRHPDIAKPENQLINNERTNNKSTTRLSCAKSSTCVAFVTLPQQRLNVITMSTNPLYANYQTLSPPAAGDPALIDEGYERKTYFILIFLAATPSFSTVRTFADVDCVTRHVWLMYSNWHLRWVCFSLTTPPRFFLALNRTSAMCEIVKLIKLDMEIPS